VTPGGSPRDDLALPDFLADYFEECDEHLTGVRRLLLSLEVSVGRAEINRPVLDELFRHFHSLKGISGMVELRQAEDLAHRLEDYLRVLRKGDAILTAEGMDALFDGTQMLEQVVAIRRSGGTFPSVGQLAGRIARLVEAAPAGGGSESRIVAPPPSNAVPRWRCTFAPSAELVARGIRVDTVRGRLSSAGEILDAVPRVAGDGSIAFDFVVAAPLDEATISSWRDDAIEVERIPDEAPAPSLPQHAPGSAELEITSPGAGASSHFVRVDLARLDEIMRSVGDLVIGRARLSDTLSRVESHIPPAEWRTIQDNTILIDRQLRTLREGVMRVRLVPVGEIFRRMPFVVRDLARETGKRVRMELQGQNTEIDKFLIERMMDPVLHLVRNAVSHGIETVAERLAAGKRPEGTIVLTAATVGGIVRIDIADDGRGIDTDAVMARAREAGLPLPHGAADAATVLSLICAPGFSTRDESDRGSGRGVGMSVVQAAVDALSGTLRLETEKGTGTRFVLELPVTLAITDALIAKVGSETFAVPQGSIREVVEVAVGALLQVECNEVMSYRGAALPIVRLSRLFGLPDATSDRLHLFVVGAGGAAIGIAVDRIVGQREIVVRTIADPLVRVDGVSGATDLGDGHVVLILDPAVLARNMRERPDRGAAIGQGANR
jgi:two-component system, chemotaxis family, sensor kinase CheA